MIHRHLPAEELRIEEAPETAAEARINQVQVEGSNVNSGAQRRISSASDFSSHRGKSRVVDRTWFPRDSLARDRSSYTPGVDRSTTTGPGSNGGTVTRVREKCHAS